MLLLLIVIQILKSPTKLLPVPQTRGIQIICLFIILNYANIGKETCVKPSHTAIKISINATAAEFICKNIFPTPVQVKKIIKNKIGDIKQIYLYQNVCK